MGYKADLSSATSAAECADQVARWGCVFRAGVSRESLATSALLYLNGNAVLLEVLHTEVTDFAPFRSVAGECLPVSHDASTTINTARSVELGICPAAKSTMIKLFL